MDETFEKSYKITCKTVKDLELYHDLEYYKDLSFVDESLKNIFIGLLYRDSGDISRMYFNIIYWMNDVSNNVVIPDFSPSPLHRDPDEWLQDALLITIGMADEVKDVLIYKENHSNEVFVDTYNALKSIGITNKTIEDISLWIYDQEESDNNEEE